MHLAEILEEREIWGALENAFGVGFLFCDFQMVPRRHQRVACQELPLAARDAGCHVLVAQLERVVYHRAKCQQVFFTRLFGWGNFLYKGDLSENGNSNEGILVMHYQILHGGDLNESRIFV